MAAQDCGYGARLRLWRKIHIGVDGQISEIRVVKFAVSSVDGAKVGPELLSVSRTR